MKVVTAQQMRQIDQHTIEQFGIPAIVLMENAGRAIVDSILRNFPNAQKIAIVIAKGNNGGDGLVIARKLSQIGKTIKIFSISPLDHFDGDALTNLKIVQNLKIPIDLVLSKREKFRDQISQFDLVVDAMFGTGLRGGLVDPITKIVEAINKTKIPTIAVDLPSGVNADIAEIFGSSINADLTVTIGLPKIGLLLNSERIGKLEIAEIGFPKSVIDRQAIRVNLTEADHVSQKLPTRKVNSHKGDYGRILVIAGSIGMTGAATLTSLACLRSGAGLVTLGVPRGLNSICENKLTEVMTLPLSETESGSIALSAKSEILEFIERSRFVLAIGPGLSQNSETAELIRQLICDVNYNKVIDADGLNAISKYPETLKDVSRNTILTPHFGEMSRLIGKPISEIERDPIVVSRNFAETHGVILILKGSSTIIADPNGEIWINSTGNSGMATAGSGDVLTGVIAGLLAQKLDPIDAAICGVYLHGLAGDLAAKKIGQHGMIATDLHDHVPIAIKKLGVTKCQHDDCGRSPNTQK